MKRVFISYSANDVQIAKNVYDILRRLGMDVWLDVYEIRPGDDVTRRIKDGINSCQLFIAIITPNSIASNWVQKELKLALERSVARKETSIVPIILAGTVVPDYLSHIQPIILSPSDYQDSLYRELSKALEFIYKERPYSSDIWFGGNDYVQEISKELSEEFPAKNQYIANSSFPIFTATGKELDEKIEGARDNLKKASRGYRIKAYVVLGMMIMLLGAAFWLFYNAGDIVSEETKKIIPLIESAQNRKNPAPKKVEAKP